MIIHLCDFCGTKTTAGAGVSESRLVVEPAMKKKWAQDHTAYRQVRAKVLVGIDGVNLPDGDEHPGHDLCDACKILVLQALIVRLESPEMRKVTVPREML